MAQPGESLIDFIHAKKVDNEEAIKCLATSIEEVREGIKQVTTRMVQYEIGGDGGAGITEEERNFLGPPEEDLNDLKDEMRNMHTDLSRLNNAVASILTAPTEEDFVIKALTERVQALEDLVAAAQQEQTQLQTPEPADESQGEVRGAPDGPYSIRCPAAEEVSPKPEEASAEAPPTIDPTTLRVKDIRNLLEENNIEVPKTVMRKHDLVDLLKKHNIVN